MRFTDKEICLRNYKVFKQDEKKGIIERELSAMNTFYLLLLKNEIFKSLLFLEKDKKIKEKKRYNDMVRLNKKYQILVENEIIKRV